MSFTESNTVERMILDTVAPQDPKNYLILGEALPGWGGSLGSEMAKAALVPVHWTYIPAIDLPHTPSDVMVELWLREALIRLNPEIKAQPDHAEPMHDAPVWDAWSSMLHDGKCGSALSQRQVVATSRRMA